METNYRLKSTVVLRRMIFAAGILIILNLYGCNSQDPGFGGPDPRRHHLKNVNVSRTSSSTTAMAPEVAPSIPSSTTAKVAEEVKPNTTSPMNTMGSSEEKMSGTPSTITTNAPEEFSSTSSSTTTTSASEDNILSTQSTTTTNASEEMTSAPTSSNDPEIDSTTQTLMTTLTSEAVPNILSLETTNSLEEITGTTSSTSSDAFEEMSTNPASPITTHAPDVNEEQGQSSVSVPAVEPPTTNSSPADIDQPMHSRNLTTQNGTAIIGNVYNPAATHRTSGDLAMWPLTASNVLLTMCVATILVFYFIRWKRRQNQFNRLQPQVIIS